MSEKEIEKPKILIADDEKSNLLILTDILNDLYTVLVAKNGSKAFEIAQTQLPDIILMDINMPDMNGYQVLQSLKNNEKLKDIPVIFITALNHIEEEEWGLALGAVDYITKPFSPAIVKARINTHLKITKQRKMIENLALLDGLTEIPNRRSYINRINYEWNRTMREKAYFSLAIIDIDSFKQYNDNYGHSKGDEALKQVATLVSNSLKRATDFVARIGGEEFAVILPNENAEDAVKIMNKICLDIYNLGILHEYSQAEEVLTVSIGGVTCIPYFHITQQSVVDVADKMMYFAKKNNKNRVEWADITQEEKKENI